jgi:hypothetical protein
MPEVAGQYVSLPAPSSPQRMPGLVQGSAVSGPASALPLVPELPLLELELPLAPELLLLAPELPLLAPELPLLPPLEVPLDPAEPLELAGLPGLVAKSVVWGAKRSWVAAPLHAKAHEAIATTLEARTKAAVRDFMAVEFPVTKRRCPTRRVHGSDSFVSPVARSFRSVTTFPRSQRGDVCKRACARTWVRFPVCAATC